MKFHTVVIIAFLFASIANAEDARFAASTSKGKLKVFILAGQSNMEGRGFPEPLTWQVTQPEYRDRYTHFIQDGDFEAFTKRVAETKDADDRRKTPEYLWSTRHDVWINYLGKHGDLTVGYGAPKEGFGPEFNFGHVVGNHFDEQVLIIKTSWGGKALARGFLPPSSMPSDEKLKEEVDELNAKNMAWNEAEPAKIEAYNKRIAVHNQTAIKKKRPRQFKPREMMTFGDYKEPYGKDYRNMVKEVHTCLAELDQRFPSYPKNGYDILGFVWFQGWNDQYQGRWLTYEENLANLIRDIRVEFKSPKMKAVVGQMGHDGKKPDKPDSPRDTIKKAQAAVAEYPEFSGNVVCVKTDQYWDMEAEAIFQGPGGWQADADKWRQFGNDLPYHYYGSPWFFAQVGTAFGDAMLDLLEVGAKVQ